MTLAYHELKASYAFVERNINLVKRYWGWELVWMLYTIANSLAVVLIVVPAVTPAPMVALMV